MKKTRTELAIRAIAIATPFTLFLLVKSIIEKRYDSAGLMTLYLLAGIYSIKIWINNISPKTTEQSS